MLNKIKICGVQINNVNFTETIRAVDELVHKKSRAFIVTPNIDHIVRLQKDFEFKKIYEEAALVLPDGMPILWAAKYLGTPLKEKVSGSDLFTKLCEISAKKEYKLFFLGGRECAAAKAADVLKTKYPGVQIVGAYYPSFGFEDDEAENMKIVEMIREAKPDILFVGLGAPKQEKWIYKYKDQHQAPVSIGIGVSFEFVSGMVKRAPVWMQKFGFEWLWRLMMEPKRLWKRYLIDDPVFFWLVLKQKLGSRR